MSAAESDAWTRVQEGVADLLDMLEVLMADESATAPPEVE